MKKFRQRLAVALTVTLLAGMATVPAFGDEVQKKGWMQEDGAWHYYNSEGEMMKFKEKYIKDKFYAFDQDGRMYENEVFIAPKTDDTTPNRYAFPDGHLAEGTWVKLNDERKLYTAEDAYGNKDIHWYYFNSGNRETQQGGEMMRSTEKTINKSVYRFDDDGRMYSREWYGTQPLSNEDLPADEAFYYQKDGAKAIDKWLPLDGKWYHFDENGNVDTIWTEDIAATATGSDAKAPFHEVEKIEPEGDREVNATVGETVTLKFKVTLASDSEARKNTFKRSGHDIWCTQTLLGKPSIKKVEENGSCTVEYKTKSLAREEVRLFVDGESSEPFIVETGLDNLDTVPVKEKADAVNTLIEALVDPESIPGDTDATLTAIKNLIQSLDDTEKQELQKEISENNSYGDLENLYVKQNGITVKPTNLSEVQSLLGNNGEISMVGAALNATGSAEFKVAPAEVPSERKSGNQSVAAFDFSMVIDNASKEELDFPARITIRDLNGFDPTKEIKLYHYHGDGEPVEETLTPVNGTCTTVKGKFSTFVFVQSKSEQPTPPNGNSSYSGSSSSSTKNTAAKGQWILGANGWWYKDSDGTWPANSWNYLEYGKSSDWYRFDKDGYIVTGWFTDADGRIYYLNPVSNGFLGAMVTGWQLIDGHWYYFNTESNGYKGMLLVNTVTPDGYHVNELGQRIE